MYEQTYLKMNYLYLHIVVHKTDHVVKNTHTCDVAINCCDFPYLMASKICSSPQEELVVDDLNTISKFHGRALFVYIIYT